MMEQSGPFMRESGDKNISQNLNNGNNKEQESYFSFLTSIFNIFSGTVLI